MHFQTYHQYYINMVSIAILTKSQLILLNKYAQENTICLIVNYIMFEILLGKTKKKEFNFKMDFYRAGS